MNESSYEAGAETQVVSATRASRWMLVVGSISLVLAALCLIATVVGMMWSFQSLANSSTDVGCPHFLYQGL
jgi:hypothetical protein